jgi:hypothetical protein
LMLRISCGLYVAAAAGLVDLGGVVALEVDKVVEGARARAATLAVVGHAVVARNWDRDWLAQGRRLPENPCVVLQEERALEHLVHRVADDRDAVPDEHRARGGH